MLWAVLARTKCWCEFYLLFLRGILMGSLLATERKTLRKGQMNFWTFYAALWVFTP
jgi:hypothetical protein